MDRWSKVDAHAATVAVLIDPPMWPTQGRLWSHLVSDTSLAELHGFAARLGVPARGFEGDHYDVTAEDHGAAVSAGAIPVGSRELLRRLRASGLRRSKRRGEKVLASRMLPDGSRRDVVLSPLAPPVPAMGHRMIALAGSDRVLLVRKPDGYDLPHLVPGVPVNPAARRWGHLRTVLDTGPPRDHVQVWLLRAAAGATGELTDVTEPVKVSEVSADAADWTPLLHRALTATADDRDQHAVVRSC